MKIDNHVHGISYLTTAQIKSFVIDKLKNNPYDMIKDGEDQITLRMFFEREGISIGDVNTDHLDTIVDFDTMKNFEKFNLKPNLCGSKKLRKLFLSHNNGVDGRYFAEAIRKTLNLKDKYTCSEIRFSIHGRSLSEWHDLAGWAVREKLLREDVRFVIQFPRRYSDIKKQHSVQDFEEMLKKMFEPIFEVTNDPRLDPELHLFLKHVVAFDCVDNESQIQTHVLDDNFKLPKEWNDSADPCFEWFLGWLAINIGKFNALRRFRSFNSIPLKTHCGEQGSATHLVTGFILAESICHEMVLETCPVLQYLYYVNRIGVASSPISNSHLWDRSHSSHPFINFYKRGLMVSLSTDDPLQFHCSNDPLLEEYGSAFHAWRLTQVEQCEIARNSVLLCGCPRKYKHAWIGPNFTRD